MAWSDVELTPRGNQKLRYEAIEDNCRVTISNSIFCYYRLNLIIKII